MRSECEIRLPPCCTSHHASVRTPPIQQHANSGIHTAFVLSQEYQQHTTEPILIASPCLSDRHLSRRRMHFCVDVGLERTMSPDPQHKDAHPTRAARASPAHFATPGLRHLHHPPRMEQKAGQHRLAILCSEVIHHIVLPKHHDTHPTLLDPCTTLHWGGAR